MSQPIGLSTLAELDRLRRDWGRLREERDKIEQQWLSAEAAISSVRALLEERRAGRFWYVRVADVLAALDSYGTVEDAPGGTE